MILSFRYMCCFSLQCPVLNLNMICPDITNTVDWAVITHWDCNVCSLVAEAIKAVCEIAD